MRTKVSSDESRPLNFILRFLLGSFRLECHGFWELATLRHSKPLWLQAFTAPRNLPKFIKPGLTFTRSSIGRIAQMLWKNARPDAHPQSWDISVFCSVIRWNKARSYWGLFCWGCRRIICTKPQNF